MAKEEFDPYLATIDRLEPDIAMIDARAGAASIAISLRRIADALDTQNKVLGQILASIQRSGLGR